MAIQDDLPIAFLNEDGESFTTSLILLCQIKIVGYIVPTLCVGMHPERSGVPN